MSEATREDIDDIKAEMKEIRTFLQQMERRIAKNEEVHAPGDLVRDKILFLRAFLVMLKRSGGKLELFDEEWPSGFDFEGDKEAKRDLDKMITVDRNLLTRCWEFRLVEGEDD